MLENPYKPTGEADTAAAAAKLVPLPSLEETEAHLQQAVVELAAYINTLVPGLRWNSTNDRASGGCNRPYDQTRGRSIYLADQVASGPIPDSAWPQALERARELAAGLGATGGQGFKEQPGDHLVRFYSPEGTVLSLGTAVNAVISSNTGCRLPAAANKNPPSSPSPTS